MADSVTVWMKDRTNLVERMNGSSNFTSQSKFELFLEFENFVLLPNTSLFTIDQPFQESKNYSLLSLSGFSDKAPTAI